MPNPSTSELPIPKSWDEFEDIVANIYKRVWGDKYVTRNGRNGQRQHGVDIFGRPSDLEGQYAGIQCKRFEEKSLTKSKVAAIVAEAEQFWPPLAGLIIATTERRDAGLQLAEREMNEERLSRNQFLVHIVFWDDLCDYLTEPSNYDLLRKFFPGWQDAFAPQEQWIDKPYELCTSDELRAKRVHRRNLIENDKRERSSLAKVSGTVAAVSFGVIWVFANLLGYTGLWVIVPALLGMGALWFTSALLGSESEFTQRQKAHIKEIDYRLRERGEE